MARQALYRATPIYRDMNRLYEEWCLKILGVNPNNIASSLAPAYNGSDIDAVVRANPAVLHYKVDPKDVSQELLDEVVATVPASDFFNKIRHLFLVPTI